MDPMFYPLLAILAVVLLAAGAIAGAWIRGMDPPPVSDDPVADMSLGEIQAWFAEEADLPVHQASHGLKILRSRPDVLRRLEELPAFIPASEAGGKV